MQKENVLCLLQENLLSDKFTKAPTQSILNDIVCLLFSAQSQHFEKQQRVVNLFILTDQTLTNQVLN